MEKGGEITIATQPYSVLKEQSCGLSAGSIHHYLSPKHVEQLHTIMNPISVKKGKYLFWEGEEIIHLYYIRSGLVKLEKTTVEGKKLNLSLYHRGDLVGEFGSEQHIFAAKVMEDAEVGLIKVKDLEHLLYQSGEFAVEFTRWLGYIQRLNQLKMRDLLLNGKTGALASTLIRLSNSYGVKFAEGIMLDIHLTNTDLADFLGMSRESVNRLLNGWKDQGVIDIVNGRILIKCLESLREICQCPLKPSCPLEVCRM